MTNTVANVSFQSLVELFRLTNLGGTDLYYILEATILYKDT